MEGLGECLKPGKYISLQVLNLSNNEISSEGINNLFKIMSKNLSMYKLILDNN
jgi:hypothetical protein